MENQRPEALLDIVPQLGDALGDADREQARQALVFPGFTLTSGVWDIESVKQSPLVHGGLIGIVVVSGTVLANAGMERRVSTQLRLPGDFVFFDGLEPHAVPTTLSYSALGSARVAALDQLFVRGCAHWPPLLRALLMEVAVHDVRSQRSQAISQMSRVEDRLLALMWTIADRAGHVVPGGARFELAITHDVLGAMIGAQRSTVSLGLTALADLELLSRAGNTWTLAFASADYLSDREAHRIRRQLSEAAAAAAAAEGDPPLAPA